MIKRKSPAKVKFIAFLLLAASLASLMLPWMKLAVDTKNGRMNPGQLLQDYVGMDTEAVRTLLQRELNIAGFSAEGVALDELLRLTLDGRFKLHELGSLCQDLSSLCGAARRPDLKSTLSALGYGVWITAGLLALLWLIALICQLTDHRWGILPYFLLGSAILAGLLSLRVQGNRMLEEQSSAFLSQYGLTSLFSVLGIDVQIIKMGIGAYLCPFLALLALLLMGIKKRVPKDREHRERESVSPYPARRREEVPPPRPVERTTWTCPNCGHRSGTEQNYCDVCGTPRVRVPAVVLCPFCGKQLPREAAYCTDCGTPIPKAETPEIPYPDYRGPGGGEG